MNLLLLFSFLMGLPDISAAEQQYHLCETRYDSSCAREQLKNLASVADARVQLLRARLHLLVAEVGRMHYEHTPASDTAERRRIGDEIDLAARAGLGILETMETTSEVYRIRADLLGTMIRTPYQATRLRKRMLTATEEALRLDPKNAHAWLSAAKPYLFATPDHGQDLLRAEEAIDKALALEPHLEQVQVLHALLREKQGRKIEAMTAWKALLDANPRCLPAQFALEPH